MVSGEGDLFAKLARGPDGETCLCNFFGVSMVTEKDVLKALGKVKEPELGRDLVSLGMIKDIAIDGRQGLVHHRVDDARLPA